MQGLPTGFACVEVILLERSQNESGMLLADKAIKGFSGFCSVLEQILSWYPTATLHYVLFMQLILHYFQNFFTKAVLLLCQNEFHKIQTSDQLLNLLPMLHTQTTKFQSPYFLYFPDLYMASHPPLRRRAGKPGDPHIINFIVYFVIITVPHTASICFCPFTY